MPLPMCTVSGTVYLVGGGVAANTAIKVKKVLKSGVLISTKDQTYRSDAAGLVTLSLPRDSVAYISGKVEGLTPEGGVALAIPDAATAVLETLVPVTLVPATGLTHTFLSLGDTPNTFVGQTLKNVRVNAGETALEFSTAVASAAWGTITGTLTAQTDVQAALDAKADDLGADDNYVTDAEKTKLSNLSGTNTGDQDISALAGKANLAGGNALTGNQTLNIGQTTSAQTDLLINPTTKASGNLIDAQVNSATKFRVDNIGSISIGGNIALQRASAVLQLGIDSGYSTLNLYSDGTLRITMTATGMIGFGGSTSAFPALKRSGNVLSFRLANDTIPAFSSLPAASAANEGALCPVSDSTTSTWGATVTGGGSNHVLCYSNGTNWTVAAA